MADIFRGSVGSLATVSRSGRLSSCHSGHNQTRMSSKGVVPFMESGQSWICTAFGQRMRVRAPAPHDSSPLRVPPTSPRDARCPARRRYMTASRAIPNGVFSPARIFRARISHVSIFRNLGSALTRFAKTPRNHTSGFASFLRLFHAFSAIHTPAPVVRPHSFHPQNTSKTKTAPSRNFLATTAQQNRVD
jgi:hypothetical protein